MTLDDGTREGTLRFDDESYGFHMDDSLSVSEALTVWGGYISSGSDMAINPGIGTDNILELGGSGESDTIRFIALATTVSGYVSISGDLTTDGIIYSQSPTDGTEEDIFIIDNDDTTDTPTVAFERGVNDEYVRWNDVLALFEFSNDLSVSGELSMGENNVSFGNGAIIEARNEDLMYLNSEVNIESDMTVNGDLSIFGAGVTTIHNGRVELGDASSNIYAVQSGDLFIENDLTVDGILYVLTVSGVGNADSTVSSSFIIDKRSATADVDVFLYFGDDTDDYANYLQWDDGNDELLLSGDLTITGNFNSADNLHVDGLAELHNDLSVHSSVTVTGGMVYGDGVSLILGSNNAGQLDVANNITLANDMTIEGNLSVAGTIYGLDASYVNVAGDTMTEMLSINPSVGTTALAVNGDIEYTGRLRNQSPVKISDGLQITNFGGVKGGQIFNKDIIIALASDMYVEESAEERNLYVPQIKYLRFSNKRPVHDELTITQEVDLHKGEFELPLRENEHIVAIHEVVCFEFPQFFTTNVGLDGVLSKEGDYRVNGQRKVHFIPSALPSKAVVYVRYQVRKDIDEFTIIDLSIDKTVFHLEKEWYVVYIEELPCEMISEHDTAAMSPITKLDIAIVPLSAFSSSADRFVVGVVTDEGNVNQYY
jgi:cytoskeletal protein CcmA (bactofilin family)